MADVDFTPSEVSQALYLCHACGTQKPQSAFYMRDEIIQRPCKTCRSESAKLIRKANPEKYREAKRKQRERQTSLLAEFGREALLTEKRLKELFHYDPETGVFTRLKNMGNAHAGDEPGYISDAGYRIITVAGIKYREHRLAWLYMTGEWPAKDVDHENLIKSDNRWKNLREATDQQNLQNQGIPKHNTSGLKGASWREDRQKWRGSICSNGKWRHLGYFDTKEEAHEAYRKAASELNGEFANFGEKKAA